MEYGIVRTLKWGNISRTQLECMITFPTHGAELPFTATANDIEAHGREIFERATKGDFGSIEDYDGPGLTRDLDKEWGDFRKKRNQLLKESDFSQFPDIQETLTDDEKFAWKHYRALLRNIPNSVRDPAEAFLVLPQRPEKGVIINFAPEDENISYEDLTPTEP